MHGFFSEKLTIICCVNAVMESHLFKFVLSSFGPSESPVTKTCHIHIVALPFGAMQQFIILSRDTLTHWSQCSGIKSQVAWSQQPTQAVAPAIRTQTGGRKQNKTKHMTDYNIEIMNLIFINLLIPGFLLWKTASHQLKFKGQCLSLLLWLQCWQWTFRYTASISIVSR